MCAARPDELTEDALLKCHRPWLSGYDQTSEGIRGKGSCGTVFSGTVRGGNPSQRVATPFVLTLSRILFPFTFCSWWLLMMLCFEGRHPGPPLLWVSGSTACFLPRKTLVTAAPDGVEPGCSLGHEASAGAETKTQHSPDLAAEVRRHLISEVVLAFLSPLWYLRKVSGTEMWGKGISLFRLAGGLLQANPCYHIYLDLR